MSGYRWSAVKSSLIIGALFVVGIGVGVSAVLPARLVHSDLALYALYALLFLVGIGVGGSSGSWTVLRQANVKIVLVPLGIITGTLLGVSAVAYWLPGVSWREALAVGSGLGYYSLSSILISNLNGETLGVVALLANVMREMLALLLTPLLARTAGKLAPIAAGGATTMDTTLPIITRFVGHEYAMIAVFNGIVLTMLVPILVTFFLR